MSRLGTNHRYNAFISYSHAADERLAPALQAGLQRLAKPWYRFRALTIFRDETGLAANPALWPSIEAGLREAEYFILLASEEAARSPWVQREVSWWLEHRDVGHLLVVLTGGTLDWDETRRDFNWSRTTSLPLALRGQFADVPLYVDARFAKTESKLSLGNVRFRDVILDLAATLHGKAKQDLDGEDVAQLRRTRRDITAGIAVLVAALAISVWQGHQARVQRDGANSRALAAEARILLESADLFESLRLAIRGVATDANEQALATLMRVVTQADPLTRAYYTGGQDAGLRFSPDGTVLGSYDFGKKAVRLWRADDAKRFALPSAFDNVGDVDGFAVGAQGRLVAAYPVSYGESSDAERSAVPVLWDTKMKVDWVEQSPERLGRTRAFAFGRDPAFFVAIDDRSESVLWRLQPDGTLRQILSLPSTPHAAFTFDGASLVTIDRRGHLSVWHLDPVRREREWILDHDASVERFAVAPGNRFLVTVHADNAVLTWHLDGTSSLARKGRLLAPPIVRDGPRPRWLDLAVNKDKVALLSDMNVYFWDSIKDSQGPVPVHTVAHNQGILEIISHALSPSARYAAIKGVPAAGLATRPYGSLVIVDTLSAEPRVDRLGIPVQDGFATVSNESVSKLFSANFSPDGHTVAFGGDYPFVTQWRLGEMGQLPNGTNFPYDIKPMIYALDHARQMLPRGVEPRAISSDGRTLLSLDGKSTVTIWSVRDATSKIVSLEADWITSLAVTNNGAHIAFADGQDEPRIIVYSVGTRARAAAHDGPGIGGPLTFSADGETLAFTKRDGSVLLWRWKQGSGAAMMTIHSAPDMVDFIELSRDSRWLVTHGELGVRVWSAATGRLIGGPWAAFLHGFADDGETLRMEPTLWLSKRPEAAVPLDPKWWITQGCRKLAIFTQALNQAGIAASAEPACGSH